VVELSTNCEESGNRLMSVLVAVTGKRQWTDSGIDRRARRGECSANTYMLSDCQGMTTVHETVVAQTVLLH
jgi:hypothetical protein